MIKVMESYTLTAIKTADLEDPTTLLFNNKYKTLFQECIMIT